MIRFRHFVRPVLWSVVALGVGWVTAAGQTGSGGTSTTTTTGSSSGGQPTLANPPAQSKSTGTSSSAKNGTLSSTKSNSNNQSSLATSGAQQTFDEQGDSFPATYPPAPMKPGDTLVFNGTITGRKYSDPRDETMPLSIDYGKNVHSLQASLASGPKGASLRMEFVNQVSGGGPVDPTMMMPQSFRVIILGSDTGGSAASHYSLSVTAK